MSMTLEELLDRQAIADLMARYTIAGDRLQQADFVATFALDGVIEASGLHAEDRFRYAGREAIAAWIGRWSERPPGAAATHGASFVRHHLTTSAVALTGADCARGRTYWIAWTDIGADHAGHYLDDFRRVDGEWLIAHRRIREDWRSPASLFAGAVRRSG